MATDICTRRLTKELKALQKAENSKTSEPRITVRPNEKNMLEMHYVIEGSKDTPYAGGFYHGKLLFPKEYPLKPPGVIMCTPNGRFQTNRRLCLSMSDFHPESWNPMWSVSTILTGLYSFMIESSKTSGSIETTAGQKRKLALQSLEYNCRDPVFGKLFPEYVDLYRERLAAKQAVLGISSTDSSSNGVTTQDPAANLLGGNEHGEANGLFALAAGIVALLAIAFSMTRFL